MGECLKNAAMFIACFGTAGNAAGTASKSLHKPAESVFTHGPFKDVSGINRGWTPDLTKGVKQMKSPPLVSAVAIQVPNSQFDGNSKKSRGQKRKHDLHLRQDD